MLCGLCHNCETVLYTYSIFSSGAVRFLRRLLGQKEECYERYVIRSHIWQHVLQLASRVEKRVNLLSSALLNSSNSSRRYSRLHSTPLHSTQLIITVLQ